MQDGIADAFTELRRTEYRLYPDAHTDSDVAMYYRDLNVVYLGGLLNYPTYAGVYRVPGYLAALDAIVAETNQETKFIPWRGPVIDRALARKAGA